MRKWRSKLLWKGMGNMSRIGKGKKGGEIDESMRRVSAVAVKVED